MSVDFIKLGLRIHHARTQRNLSQEEFAEYTNLTREHICRLEQALRKPTVDTLVEIANALDVSADDLLVDSLKHSSSTADTELHKLLLDCNEAEEQILIELIKHMKTVLYRIGI